ncbi:hypothetical protein BDV59DRAFT_46147 [Aspergillus ambiguus]|uniref:uncharacterized protein n=1 Tax=Aspergillus ambiguus TaxID=176160 RepID=UPI003CCD0D2C
MISINIQQSISHRHNDPKLTPYDHHRSNDKEREVGASRLLQAWRLRDDKRPRVAEVFHGSRIRTGLDLDEPSDRVPRWREIDPVVRSAIHDHHPTRASTVVCSFTNYYRVDWRPSSFGRLAGVGFRERTGNIPRTLVQVLTVRLPTHRSENWPFTSFIQK